MYRKHLQNMESDNTSETNIVNKTGIKTIDKIVEIPVVDTALNKVNDYYGHIKEKNGLLRTGCNLAEMSLKTLRFASTPLAHLMSRPIEQVDTYFSDKVDLIENTYPSIKQPTDQITTAAYTQAKDLYDKTNDMINKPKETLYNFKDLTVSTATTCGTKVLETCLENRYAKMVCDPVLDYTEKSLDYYLPEQSVVSLEDQGTIRRLYNINKRVYSHVYEATFIQLSKLHMHFERTIQKMQSLKNLMDEIYKKKKEQIVSVVSESTLYQRCQNYMISNNLSLERLEELSRGYYKAILADVNDILERYMGLVKDFPAYLQGIHFKEKIDYLKNLLNKEAISIYLSFSIDYLKQINNSLISYTNKMFEVVGESRNNLSSLYQGTISSEPRENKTN